MKLSDIKPLNEAVTPIHIVMLLKEICKQEKCTNTVHFILLAQLLERFKYGSKMSIRYLNEFPTNKDILDSIKSLSCKEQCELSAFFLKELAIDEWTEQWVNTENSIRDWIKSVLRKQK